MGTKRKLSIGEILNMSVGFFGIQFGFALQNANTSRIFRTLGAAVDEIPILWIAAPVTGLLVQPIIGYYSDRTWTKLGRRRPYFLVGAILASIALFIMPNSQSLLMAAITLWMMDASINVSMEPFRAFVGDNLPNEQRTLGFAAQSFFIGLGAVLGSILPWLFTNVFHISNTAETGIVPDSVKWSFYIGGIVFLVSVLWTVVSTTEYSPQELAEFNEKHEQIMASRDEVQDLAKEKSKLNLYGSILIVVGLILSILVWQNNIKQDVYILSFGLLLVGILFVITASLKQYNPNNAFVHIISDLLTMPTTMKQLAAVQFFSWFALFSMWIYTTDSVAENVFHTADSNSQAFNDAGDWVSFLFAFYNGIAALVAFLLPVMARKTNNKITHLVALCLGGLGLISIFFIENKFALIWSMAGVGIAWASILSIPYAMLSSSLPSDKMGYYMGVFNFFIVLPQIVAATILGFLVQSFFNEQAIYALLIGGLSLILAGLLTLRVKTQN